jgi:hypothetical protein
MGQRDLITMSLDHRFTGAGFMKKGIPGLQSRFHSTIWLILMVARESVRGDK